MGIDIILNTAIPIIACAWITWVSIRASQVPHLLTKVEYLEGQQKVLEAIRDVKQ